MQFSPISDTKPKYARVLSVRLSDVLMLYGYPETNQPDHTLPMASPGVNFIKFQHQRAFFALCNQMPIC
jgi:hypothetical protein